MKVRPRPLGAPTTRLSPEEGFVLSRIDGRLSVADLATLTGLEERRLEQIVTKLASQGAVALDPEVSSARLPDVGSAPDVNDLGSEQTSMADFAAVLGLDPTAFAAHAPAGAVEAPVDEQRVEPRSNYPPPQVPGDTDSAVDLAASSRSMRAAEPHGDGEGGDELEEVPDELEEVIEDEPEAAKAAASEHEVLVAERNYRQLYEKKFHALPVDARIYAAKVGSGADLMALCLDVDPKVIAAILENASVGLDNVRMIAFHHHTQTGLEILSRRRDFLADMLVERRLLRNPQAGDMTLQRIMANKRILAVYKIAIDREIPELTRVKSRGYLRKSWQGSTPEERSEIVLRTEARCMQYLTGCTFDAKTTAILCGKNYASAMFVQSIAKFPAAPPALLAHLYKQAFVRKSPPLRKMLLQHPNMPGEVKRNG